MGYPNETLKSRAVVKNGFFAVLPPDGLVNNVIPGLRVQKASILASPKLGAGFVQYILTLKEGDGTAQPFEPGGGIEKFIYVLDGDVTVHTHTGGIQLAEGGYYFCPACFGLEFTCTAPSRVLLYKQKYTQLGSESCPEYAGSVHDIGYRIYDGMENVLIKDLLPTDPVFDMNMHILSFKPGGCHPFVETHVQEHGMYILSGEGMYLLGDSWMPTQKDDFIWMGAYAQQGAYGVGRGDFTYIYSKDCNRDVTL